MVIISLIAVMFWRRSRAVEDSYVAELDDKEAPSTVRFERCELEDEERRRHELPGLTAVHELEQKEWPRYELAAE